MEFSSLYQVEEEDGDEEALDEGQEEAEEGQEEALDEGQEEAVVVDADSTDGAVLVNGNDEEWGTNNEGNPSA